MNREIKFRGKDINTGEWVHGSLLSFSSGKLSIAPTKSKVFVASDEVMTLKKVHDVDPATVGQFTGLRDIARTEEFPEGQEIFEDDLLQSQVGAMYIWQVKFEDGAYILEQINGPKKRGKQRHVQDFCCKDDIEFYQLVKIGNIYDNPELLEGVAG